jgi:alkylation response protein AidB-like acyl-CoA dehydrogenase
MRTKAVAKLAGDGGRYKLTGQKHFGSGSGNADYMITTALPEGDERPDFFFLHTLGAAWDGSTGMKLVAEWDGHGMTATQSHAFDFADFPATRVAWPGARGVISGILSTFAASIFTGVVLGVAEAAVERARVDMARRKDTLRPLEEVEWVRVENELWTAQQAYEGLLRAVEAKGDRAGLECLQGKTVASELVESLTSRICHIVGGGSFHRSSPYGAAFEDVRALGFLRPPWVLSYDQIAQRIWERAAATSN